MYEMVLFANTLIWLALVGHFLTLRFASSFHPAAYYLFFHGLVFTFRPIIVEFNKYDSIYINADFFPSDSDKLTVIYASILGLLSFYSFCVKFGNENLVFKYDAAVSSERKSIILPCLIVLVFILPLAVASALDNWDSRAQDTSTMVFDHATGVNFNTTRSGYWSDFQLLLGPLSVITVWIFRFRWWSFLPLVGFVVLRAGTGGRWPFLMTCASVGLLFLYERRKRLPKFKELVLPLAALLLFQSVGEDRGAAIRSIFIEDRSIQGIVTPNEQGFLEGMDFANLEYFEFLVYVVPQRTGSYNYFIDNLQILTEPIPRIWWEDKPLGPPIKFFQLWEYGRPIGMTYSLPGYGWMQLGYLGVAIWCAFFGWIYGKIYNWFQKSNQSNFKIISYMLMLPLSLQVFRDGLLLTMVKTHTWFLFPIVMIYGFARLSAVPLADEVRLLAYRRAARRRPDIAAKILARQRGAKRSVLGRNG